MVILRAEDFQSGLCRIPIGNIKLFEVTSVRAGVGISDRNILRTFPSSRSIAQRLLSLHGREQSMTFISTQRYQYMAFGHLAFDRHNRSPGSNVCRGRDLRKVRLQLIENIASSSLPLFSLRGADDDYFWGPMASVARSSLSSRSVRLRIVQRGVLF